MSKGRRGCLTVIRAGPALLLLLALAVLCSQLAAGADVISSSKLESCIADGSQPQPQSGNVTAANYIACSQKLIVVLTVDSGDSISTQDLNFQLSCIGSPTGVCPCPCNYAADKSCTCRDLASTVNVKLTKSPLWASYPLMYLQSFNFKPYESIVRPSNGECKDGQYDEMPTCGWYYSMGQRVVDSQGFVCQCESSVIWDSTFGTNTQRTRANLNCDFFANLDILLGKIPCSAHCLMMDPHWYGGYSLGEASMQFEITATITTTASGSNPPAPGDSEVLKLSPWVPVAVSSNRTLSAKLLGDLAGYTQIPVLSERVLMLPHPKQGQTLQDVFANRSEWMLIDRSRISFDGGECDKVGTSFSAFRYQSGGCRRAPQVCLSNQLRDLLEADRARIAQGRNPLYLVSQYTYGLSSELKAFRAGALSFALPVTGIRSSVVQLEAAAESLRFVTNNSPGKILAARMCTFAETRCGGFEASAASGYLHAWLANVGTLPASYTIIVTDCTVNIRPVDAQRVALAAGQNGTISPFRIYVEDDQAASRSCWIKMLDATGLVTDAKQVDFFTNATAYEDWPSGGLLGNGTGAGELVLKNCTAACPNKMDMLCAFKNRCWSNIGGFVGLFLGIAAGAGLLFLALKYGWIASLMSMCCSGGGGGGLLSCCGGGNNNNISGNNKSDAGKGGKEQQQRRRSSAAAAAEGGSRSKGKQQKQKGRKSRKGASRSSADSSGDGGFDRSSSRGSFEEDQYSSSRAAAAKGGSSRDKGRPGSSTSRRPSAAAAAANAAAAAAAAAAAGRRRRSGQPSGVGSNSIYMPGSRNAGVDSSGFETGYADPHAGYALDDPQEQWGSGAGAAEEGWEAAAGRSSQRPFSSSTGGSRRGSRNSRMQQQQQQPRLPVRSSSVERGGGRGGVREGPASAYGGVVSSSGRQPVKQGRGRRPSGSQSSPGGAAGFADGFIPAVWNPMYGGDNGTQGADGINSPEDYAYHDEDGGYDDESGVVMSSPPRAMRMTSTPVGQQQQQQQQGRSGSRTWERERYGQEESFPQAPRRTTSSAPGSRSASPAAGVAVLGAGPGGRYSPAAGLGVLGGGSGGSGLSPASRASMPPGLQGMQGRGQLTAQQRQQQQRVLHPREVFLDLEGDEGSGELSGEDGGGEEDGYGGYGGFVPQQQPQQQRQQQNIEEDDGDEDHQSYGRRPAAVSMQQQQQRGVRPSAAAAAMRPLGSSRPSSSGYVSDSGVLWQQQRQQQQQRMGAGSVPGSNDSSPVRPSIMQQQGGQGGTSSPSALRSFASSPGAAGGSSSGGGYGQSSSPVRAATPGRAVLQPQSSGSPPPAAARAAASAAAAGGGSRRQSSSTAVGGVGGAAGGSSRSTAGRASSATAAAAPARVGVPGVPAVHARAAATEQYRPQARSPFAAASSPGGSPPPPQQQQQRRMTVQPQQQQQLFGSVEAAAAMWESAAGGGSRGANPRSPTRRPRSSSSNSSSGLSPTGQQLQQQYRQQQQQQQRRMGPARQDDFFMQYSDGEQ